MITNAHSGTRIDEIASGIYRIHTPIPPEAFPGGFSFNQYLIAAERPVLFHTGPRKLFEVTREAVSAVLPPENLAFVGLSHVEADECGALVPFLEVAAGAAPLCSHVAANVSVSDLCDREPRPLADGEVLDVGGAELVWIDAPHVPHGWDCGFLFERRTRTLLCGDLFTQPGTGEEALTEGDILEPSEAFRAQMDYFAHAPDTRAAIERMAGLEPTTLACMHGSAWRGNGAKLLRALGDRLGAS